MMTRAGSAALRWVAAIAILVSGVVHFKLWWFSHYRVLHVIGPLFLLNAIAAVVIALLLAWRANLLTELAGLGFAVTTLGAFYISVYYGLFGFREALRGPNQLTAEIAEGVAIVLLAPAVAVHAVRAWRRLRDRRGRRASSAGAASRDAIGRP